MERYKVDKGRDKNTDKNVMFLHKSPIFSRATAAVFSFSDLFYKSNTCIRTVQQLNKFAKCVKFFVNHKITLQTAGQLQAQVAGLGPGCWSYH